MTDEQTVDSGETTQEYTSEEPDIGGMSEDDLDTFLDETLGKTEEETGDKAGEGEQTEDQTQEPETVTVSKSEYEALQAKLNKQETINDNNQEFIQRREQQFGDIRGQLTSTKNELVSTRQQLVTEMEKARDEDRVMDAVNAKDKIQAVDQQLGQVDQQNMAVTKIQETQKVVSQHIKPEEIVPEDVEACLRRDGYSDQHIQNFKQRMYLDWSAEGIINLVKRSQAERAVREVVGIARGLSEKLKKLEAGEGADNVLKKVEKEMNKTPQITAASSGSNSGRHGKEISEDSIDTSKLSEAELNKLCGIG